MPRSERVGGIDYPLFIVTSVAALAGIAMIQSATHKNGLTITSLMWIKQISWFGLGLAAMIGIIRINYRVLKDLAPIIYGLAIISLIGVLFSPAINYTRSWFTIGPVSIQPSEFAKLAAIIALASFMAGRKEIVASPLGLIISFLIVGLPVALILKQPDVGTSLVFIPILLVMLYAGSARGTHLLAIMAIGVLSMSLPLLSSWVQLQPEGSVSPLVLSLLKSAGHPRKIGIFLGGFGLALSGLFVILRFIRLRVKFAPFFLGFLVVAIGLFSSTAANRFLQGYQRKRLLVFLDPGIDPLGAGYNIIQSKIAIGSGGILGKGWRAGTQSQLGFLPEQPTDFIFSVVGEEWGFVGSCIILSLLLFIIYRALGTAFGSEDDFSRLIAVGIAAMIGAQTLINVGMTIGIMPVTGLPLPLISYGGSSLFVTMLSLGILINIRYRKNARRYSW
ncbi:MAG: rod shape-determining protein RodA [bacterium]|nr:rod shape-determining protein RodA [bacterium]